MPTESPAAAPASDVLPAPAATPATSQQTTSAPVTPGSKAWAEMSQEQRHAQLRGPENPRARAYSPARDQREAAADRPAGEAQPSADQQREPAADGTKYKVGKYEVSEADLGAMMDRQAQDDLRKATVPPTPDAYKLEISPDAKLPGNVTFKFDGNDPGLVAAKAWAHSKGLDQSAFSEMLTLYASHQAQQEAALAERSRQEIAKAGVNAPQRVDAVGKWITGMVGEADARPIRATIVTDAHLRFYEKLMTREVSQGAAAFSSAHRVPADDGKIPNYAGMTFEQRRQAQDQNAARRIGR